jgi:hypothetical protein
MHLTEDEKKVMQAKVGDKEAATVTVHAVEEDEAIERAGASPSGPPRVARNADQNEGVTSTVDVAVNEALTGKVLIKILSSPQTWLPARACRSPCCMSRQLSRARSDVHDQLWLRGTRFDRPHVPRLT